MEWQGSSTAWLTALGSGVVVAVLFHAREPLLRMSRDLIRKDELNDLLWLCASALISLP